MWCLRIRERVACEEREDGLVKVGGRVWERRFGVLRFLVGGIVFPESMALRAVRLFSPHYELVT